MNIVGSVRCYYGLYPVTSKEASFYDRFNLMKRPYLFCCCFVNDPSCNVNKDLCNLLEITRVHYFFRIFLGEVKNE